MGKLFLRPARNAFSFFLAFQETNSNVYMNPEEWEASLFTQVS